MVEGCGTSRRKVLLFRNNFTATLIGRAVTGSNACSSIALNTKEDMVACSGLVSIRAYLPCHNTTHCKRTFIGGEATSNEYLPIASRDEASDLVGNNKRW